VSNPENALLVNVCHLIIGVTNSFVLPHEGIRKRVRGGGHFEDPLCTEELKLKAEEHISRLVESSGSDSDTSDGETA